MASDAGSSDAHSPTKRILGWTVQEDKRIRFGGYSKSIKNVLVSSECSAMSGKVRAREQCRNRWLYVLSGSNAFSSRALEFVLTVSKHSILRDLKRKDDDAKMQRMRRSETFINTQRSLAPREPNGYFISCAWSTNRQTVLHLAHRQASAAAFALTCKVVGNQATT